nr:ribonuclease [Clostridia bacterium]
MVIYGLTAEVDGSDRDKLVGGNDYLYQFIGKDIPLTIGDKKTDDVAPLKESQQTSKDLVAALNSLVEAPAEEKKAKPSGPIIEPQAIADYIFEHGKLPDNFITKKEAQKLGWDSSRNYVGDVAPGKSIGGDRFGNYEGRLPSKKGRTWYEADCYYQGKKRNAHRILYSSDGLVYYTDDHYETFTQMFPSKK